MSGYVLVKICGITTSADAEAAIDAGADALGFNFWPGSPRFLTAGAVADITWIVKGRAKRVGVWVDATSHEIDVAFDRDWIDVAQLHGAIPQNLQRPYWQAFPAGAATESALQESRAEAFLVDTPAGAQRGGTGRTFDWHQAAGLPGRIILAGGLGPDNVAEAIRVVKPWGVDACSRLEIAPGRKDPEKMKQFVAAVRRETL